MNSTQPTVRPRRPWIAWLLAVLVPPFYWWYWYWQLVRDLRRVGRSRGVADVGPRPAVAVLMVSIGAVVVIPLVVSLVQTGRLIRRCQETGDAAPRCRVWVAPVVMLVGVLMTLLPAALGGIAAVLVFVTGLAVTYFPVAYLQGQANVVLSNHPEAVRRPLGGRLVALAGVAVLWSCVAFPVTVLGGAGLLKPYKVPAGSMEPTFRCGDRFLSESVTERSRNPRRGDVVAFHPPAGIGFDGTPDSATVQSDPTASGEVEVVPADVTFFKRVIGLPGDTVELKDHRAIVNGEELDEPYVLTAENSPEGLGDMTEREVPSETYLMLGDHRDNSADSRVFGFVPQSFIVGRAAWIYWPPAHFGSPPASADQGYAGDGPDPACLGSAPPA